MSSWRRSGRRRTGSSAPPPDRAAAGDGAGTGKLGVLWSVSYPLLAVLSLLRSLLCWLWSRTTAAVSAEPRAADEPGGVKGQRRDGGRSPERADRVRSHHGRAFEFISAALRIDEDEQGILMFCPFLLTFSASLFITPDSIRKSVILTLFSSMSRTKAFCKLNKNSLFGGCDARRRKN